jgi:hypothetical protein
MYIVPWYLAGIAGGGGGVGFDFILIYTIIAPIESISDSINSTLTGQGSTNGERL